MGAWTCDRKIVAKEQQEDGPGFVPMGLPSSNGHLNAGDVFQNALRYGKYNNAATDAGKEEFRKYIPAWNLTLQNALDVKDIYTEKNLPRVRVFDNGTCYERLHAECKVLCDLDLADFPLDFQLLEFVVSLDVSTEYATFANYDRSADGLDGFEYIYKDSTVNNKGGFVAQEWHLANSRRRNVKTPTSLENAYNFGVVAHGKNSNQGNESKYSRITIQIPLQRDPSYYVNTIFLPLLIVTGSAFFAFSITETNMDKDKVKDLNMGNFLTYLSTLLLTIIGLKWNVSEKLPKTRKPSFLMYLFSLSYAFIAWTMFVGIACEWRVIDINQAFSLVFILFMCIVSYAVGKYWCCAKRRREAGEAEAGGVFFQRLVDGKLRSIHDTREAKDGKFLYDPWQFSQGNWSGFYHIVDAVCSLKPVVGLQIGVIGWACFVLYCAW